MWVYSPNSELLLQPFSGETFTIYCFTANSDYSLSFKLNNQTLSANENITIDPVPIPPAVGKQLGVTIKAFSMATAGILTCQAHSSDNLIQEISEAITGQSKEEKERNHQNVLCLVSRRSLFIYLFIIYYTVLLTFVCCYFRLFSLHCWQ